MERRTPAAMAVLIGTVLAVPAAAQFGGIFGEPAPRPPGSVPGGRQQSPTPAPSNVAPPPGGPYGAIQSLPPPTPGATLEPPARAPAQGPQRQQRASPQPADTSPQPGDEVVAEPSTQRVVNNAALFTGLDKITGRIINFDVGIGETVQFGALQLTPRACYTRPATETAKTDAFVEVDEVTLQGEVRRIFTGWMFAASPGLHAVEHSIYDIWLNDCKGPAVTAEKPPDPAPAPAARTQARPQQPSQPTQQRRNNAPPQQTLPIR